MGFSLNFSCLLFSLTLNDYKLWSRKMRWTEFFLSGLLHIGHFFCVLMTLLMHGEQNKWPHIVDRILSMVNISRQTGHFVIPTFAFRGDLLLLSDVVVVVIAVDAGWSALAFPAAFFGLSKLSHKSMVANVRYVGRTSVTKITSSSSFGPIGLIVPNRCAPPTITTLSSRLRLVRLAVACEPSVVAISSNTTRASTSATWTTLFSGVGFTAPFVSELTTDSCCWVSRRNSSVEANNMSASRNKSSIDESSTKMLENFPIKCGCHCLLKWRHNLMKWYTHIHLYPLSLLLLLLKRNKDFMLFIVGVVSAAAAAVGFFHTHK